MLNLFQHLFLLDSETILDYCFTYLSQNNTQLFCSAEYKIRKFKITLDWITSSLCCLGLFGISQKRGFAQSNGLDTTCRHPTENPFLVMTWLYK